MDNLKSGVKQQVSKELNKTKKDKFNIFDVLGKNLKGFFLFITWYITLDIILMSIYDIEKGLAHFLRISSAILTFLLIKFAVTLIAFFAWKIAKKVFYSKKKMEEDNGE